MVASLAWCGPRNSQRPGKPGAKLMKAVGVLFLTFIALWIVIGVVSAADPFDSKEFWEQQQRQGGGG